MLLDRGERSITTAPMDRLERSSETTAMILLPLLLCWVQRPMQFAVGTRWSLLVVVAAALMIAAPQCAGTDPQNGGSQNPVRSIERHREGARIANIVGSLRDSGRRWIFTPDSGNVAYRVLENQSLERIVNALQEDPQDRHWTISGTFTEFRDENFLLITRVERAARSDL